MNTMQEFEAARKRFDSILGVLWRMPLEDRMNDPESWSTSEIRRYCESKVASNKAKAPVKEP